MSIFHVADPGEVVGHPPVISSASISPERISRCCSIVRDALLAERNERGHWTGELSTSALSTATAIMALEMVRRAQPADLNPRRSTLNPPTADNSLLSPLIRAGLHWLAEHQNADGGWGDTTKSLSNISTTMLARAVFRATGTEDEQRSAVDAAVRYIDAAGGVPAVLARYGRDRTFSIPILTHCALAGLVDWREVKPLPFELACLPPRFYKTVRLPVVSYALPALIAIGQVRHHFRKPWNPVTRLVRRLAIGPSLRRLEQIQPTNGGFLEATPLTSFVTMSLAGMGLAGHPVARRGAEFIVNSVRPDGSWPIDTNLATWVTTLAVNALGDDLPEDAREPILRWLLDQQYKEMHPYTNADPGGWAWTDLPGGVPDGDDTPGAILAILKLVTGEGSGVQNSILPAEDLASGRNAEPAKLNFEHPTPSRARMSPGTSTSEAFGDGWTPPIHGSRELHAAVDHAVTWLVSLQNRDDGWPTFCRGWGNLPFDRSAPDLTAHVIRALLRWNHPCGELPGHLTQYEWKRANDSLRNKIGDLLDELALAAPYERRDPLQIGSIRAVFRGLSYLETTQRPDGSWLPLWFGNQHVGGDENPVYGTARVLAAYRDAGWPGVEPAKRGVNWLIANQNPDGGWGGVHGTPSSVEETALATEIVLSFDPQGEASRRGVAWLLDRVEDGSFREPAPIGFYFARLWYFELLYPLIFATAALRRACWVYSGGDQNQLSTPKGFDNTAGGWRSLPPESEIE